ncbi:MAG: NifB/NifX family molybdenum-iron cluster-binding protein [Promethearchaeota archaeon]
MSVIALPSNGEGGLNDSLSTRFGRCNNITIVSIEDRSIIAVKVIPIEGDKTRGNLGIYISKLIKENKVSEVIVKYIGSKAYKALSSENIQIFNIIDKDLSLKECIEKFNQGDLQQLESPNAHLIED